MDNLYSSFYLYRKYEIIGDELVDLGITSIDADGTQELVMKEKYDPACGCPPPDPVYRWVQTENTICVEYVPPTPTIDGKFRLTLSDSSTVSAECDGTSAVTSGEVSSQYSGSVVSAEIGDCVTEIAGNTFRSCSALTSIDLGTSVTTIGTWAFGGCSALTEVTLPSTVTAIGYNAFNRCINLTNFTVPSGVSSLETGLLYNCTSLTRFTIPSGITYIGDMILYNCTGLTAITVEPTTPPTMSTLNKRQFDNTNNCPIYVPSGSVNTYKAADGWSTYASRIQAIS